MSFLLLARIVGIPLLLGAATLLVSGFEFRRHRLSFPGWAWLLGSAEVGLLTLGWLAIGLESVPAWGIDAGCIALAGALLLLSRRATLRRGATREAQGRYEPEPPDEDGGWGSSPRWERMLFLATVALVLAITGAHVVLSSRHAIVSGDEAIFWSFRPKILWEHGGLNAAYSADVLRHRMPNAEYPLLNPLLQTWFFAHVGQITHVANRIPLQLYSFALLLILGGALQRVCRPALAAALLVLVATMPQTLIGSKVAQSDIMVCCGSVMALDAWLRMSGPERARWLGLGAFAVAFVVWSKLEGLILCASGLAALVLSPRVLLAGLRRRREWLWALLPLGMVVLNWSLNRLLDAKPAFGRSDGAGALIAGFLERFADRGPVILAYFSSDVLLDPRHAHLVLAAFLALVVSGGRLWLRTRLRVPTLLLLVAIVAYLAVFLIVPSQDVNWHLATAAQRLFHQLALPMTLWVGVVLGRASAASVR